MYDKLDFSMLLGKTLASVTVDVGKEGMTFTTTDGESYRLFHVQDCCESVTLQDIVGDLTDLIGVPLTMAEEVSGETPNDWHPEYMPESFTWTFYKLATVRGYVTLRWLGTSNGYYSESVTFAKA